MSQVLKRLTILTDNGLLLRGYPFNSASKSVQDLSKIQAVPYSAVTGTLLRPRHQRIIVSLLKGVNGKLTNPCVNSHRSMSILTDLLRRKKKDDQEDVEEEEAIPEARTLALLDPPTSLTEEEIEAKRDISRLNSQHRRLVNGQLPYPEPMTWIHHTVRYKQKMFGKYGESSGVNPGLLWPTAEGLALTREFEQVAYPFTIQEMVEKKRLLRLKQKEAYERRRKDVEERMATVDKYKEDLEKRIEAKDKEASEAKARREKLVEEVRRHFGYTVDPREEKFQELLQKKEKEQKKQMKEARKLEKQQKVLDKLEGKAAPEKPKKSGSQKIKDDYEG